ncbi:sulfite exporter TauE/SafE family protein [Streptomyces sp. ATexAB-D23]|uniref:sulfite exporter TauE/SafE family protein n=1 Tax=unclassified Streptomyces TaxID=2593676 RepID=UPI000369863E|nr:sulfite exporter TauE/SafE family protein [Streptomyces sp. ATexAB-D23]MYY01709.1 TSUP family transporter [Streptomyces sp. SID4913]
MHESLDALTLVLLALFGLAGGIGITAVGPGGVLPTIGMFLLTGLSPSTVAGTAIATHIATGTLGTAAFARSGQFKAGSTRHTVTVLAATALVGTPVGVLLNTLVSGRAFGVLLACAVTVTAVLVRLRDHRERRAGAVVAPLSGERIGTTPSVAVGLVVAVAAGLFGLGGPMLSVPLLVVCGLPVLTALAAAQAQSVVIAAIGTAGFALHGSVDWWLAAVVGVPELVGVLIGWRIAHAVPERHLKYALVGALLALAPYLALHA